MVDWDFSSEIGSFFVLYAKVFTTIECKKYFDKRYFFFDLITQMCAKMTYFECFYVFFEKKHECKGLRIYICVFVVKSSLILLIVTHE